MFSRVITSKSHLKRVASVLHSNGLVVVTTNGCFDILHLGHIYLFEEAAKLGDVVIVGVNSDSSVRRYKGSGRPIQSQLVRSKIVSAIRYVGFVYVFNEVNPIEFVKTVRPDFHLNSDEYGRDCVEAETVKKCGGKLVILKKQKRFQSTTSIIQKVINQNKKR